MIKMTSETCFVHAEKAHASHILYAICILNDYVYELLFNRSSHAQVNKNRFALITISEEKHSTKVFNKSFFEFRVLRLCRLHWRGRKYSQKKIITLNKWCPLKLMTNFCLKTEFSAFTVLSISNYTEEFPFRRPFILQMIASYALRL